MAKKKTIKTTENTTVTKRSKKKNEITETSVQDVREQTVPDEENTDIQSVQENNIQDEPKGFVHGFPPIEIEDDDIDNYTVDDVNRMILAAGVVGYQAASVGDLIKLAIIDKDYAHDIYEKYLSPIDMGSHKVQRPIHDVVENWDRCVRYEELVRGNIKVKLK